MTQNSGGGQPGGGWVPQGGGYGGFYAPPAGGAAPPPGPPGDGSPQNASASEAIAFGWRAVFGDYTRTALPLIVALIVYAVFVLIVAFGTGLVAKGIASALGISVIPPIPTTPVQPGDFSRIWINTMRSQFTLMAIQEPLAIVLNAAVSALFLPGIYGFSLKLVRGEQPEFGQVFTGTQHFGAFFVAALLQQVVVFGGLLLCIIPGIIVALGTSLYVFCVIDRGVGGLAAIKESWRITTGNKMNMLLYYILSGLVSLGALIACCLPVLLVAMPVTTIALAHMYAAMTGQIPSAAPGSPAAAQS